MAGSLWATLDGETEFSIFNVCILLGCFPEYLWSTKGNIDVKGFLVSSNGQSKNSHTGNDADDHKELEHCSVVVVKLFNGVDNLLYRS